MKALLVDGFNLAYRCFFAIPDLTRADGFPTNALHGWARSIWMLADQEKPDAIAVFFDLGGSQRHLALHADYKAQRAEMPEALEKQVPELKTLTRLLGLKLVEQNGVEGDDLLASEAVALAQDGHDVLILSSDKDFAQLVNERIAISLPPPTANPKLGWRRMDPAAVKEKFGVPPEQIAEYLALMGDTSDNIPGISGVGPKTAAKWLAQYGSLENLLAKAGEIQPERFRTPLAEGASLLRRNLQLTTLVKDLPVVPMEKPGPVGTELFRYLEQMEMKGTLVEAKRRYEQPELFS